MNIKQLKQTIEQAIPILADINCHEWTSHINPDILLAWHRQHPYIDIYLNGYRDTLTPTEIAISRPVIENPTISCGQKWARKAPEHQALRKFLISDPDCFKKANQTLAEWSKK